MDFSTCSKDELNLWFKNLIKSLGLKMMPDNSLDIYEFASQYSRNPKMWELAFSFFIENDLMNLPSGRYDIMDDKVYALVNEYQTKELTDTKLEAHRIYTDIQYVLYGKELIGITSINNCKRAVEYNHESDIEFLESNSNELLLADNSHFFIFFPNDAHRPCIKYGDSTTIRKIVIKIMVSES